MVKIIRDQYLVDAKAYNKIMGIPITKGELIDNKNSKMIIELKPCSFLVTYFLHGLKRMILIKIFVLLLAFLLQNILQIVANSTNYTKQKATTIIIAIAFFYLKVTQI